MGSCLMRFIKSHQKYINKLNKSERELKGKVAKEDNMRKIRFFGAFTKKSTSSILQVK